MRSLFGFAGMVEPFCCRNPQSPPKSLMGSACKRGNMGLRPQIGEDTRPAEKSNSLSSGESAKRLYLPALLEKLCCIEAMVFAA